MTVPETWFVCQHPERPSDLGAALHAPADLCPGCVIFAEAALMRGETRLGSWLDDVGEVEAALGVEAVPGRPPFVPPPALSREDLRP